MAGDDRRTIFERVTNADLGYVDSAILCENDISKPTFRMSIPQTNTPQISRSIVVVL